MADMQHPSTNTEVVGTIERLLLKPGHNIRNLCVIIPIFWILNKLIHRLTAVFDLDFGRDNRVWCVDELTWSWFTYRIVWKKCYKALQDSRTDKDTLTGRARWVAGLACIAGMVVRDEWARLKKDMKKW